MEGQISKAANHRFKSGAAFDADEVKITNHIYLCVCMCVCAHALCVFVFVFGRTSYVDHGGGIHLLIKLVLL